MKYMEDHYLPKNSFLVAVGDLKKEQVLGLVKRFFSERTYPKAVSKETSKAHFHSGAPVIREKRVNQVYLQMGWPIPGAGHGDLPYLDILELILGHGKASKLQRALRIKDRLVNSISAGSLVLREAGIFTLFSTLEDPRVTPAIEGIIKTIEEVKEGKVSLEELEMAKKKTTMDLLSEMETMAGQARNLGYFEAFYNDYSALDSFLDKIYHATLEDIIGVARKYLDLGKARLVIHTPKGFDEGSLKNYFGGQRQGPRGLYSAPIKPSSSSKNASLYQLPNGIRIVISERKDLPLVSIVAALGGGLRLETREKNGISAATANMLLRGTKRLSYPQLMEIVEGRGASIDRFSGRNSLGITLRCLSKDTTFMLRTMAEVLLSPSFPQDELEKVKKDLIASIQAKQDKPFFLAMDLFAGTLFRHHPYGMPESGTIETVNKLTRDDIIKWYGSILVPSNLVISVVGDVDLKEVLEVLSLELGGLKGDLDLALPSPEPQLEGIRTSHLSYPSNQSHLILGFLDVGQKDIHSPAMALINTALSNQGGILFKRLRDEMGLAYVVTSVRVQGIENSAFFTYIACDPQKAHIAKESILEILTQLKEQGISPKELEEAKNNLVGSMLMAEQRSGAVALRMALDELYGLGFAYGEQILELIKNLTPEEVRAAANKVMGNPYVFVSVGPGH